MGRPRKNKGAATPNKTAQLPGMTGAGVAPIEIAEVAKAITRYERAKEKRCQVSPDEIATKRALEATLHKHAGALPLNKDGNRFYRQDDVDYILKESLLRRRSDDGEGAGGDAEKFPAMTEEKSGD